MANISIVLYEKVERMILTQRILNDGEMFWLVMTEAVRLQSVILIIFMFLHVGQKPVQFNSYGAKSQQTNNENIPAETMKAYKNITSGSVITRSQDISHWKHLSN